jgi:hypothetical protein
MLQSVTSMQNNAKLILSVSDIASVNANDDWTK